MSLVTGFELESPFGWVDLEDAAAGYELHKDSFAARATTHRKGEISTEWIGGSYTTRSVKENVLEDLVVWVTGATHHEMDARLEVILESFESLSYGARKTVGNLRETWQCSPADYTVETSQEFTHATIALVRARVPRLPFLVKELVP